MTERGDVSNDGSRDGRQDAADVRVKDIHRLPKEYVYEGMVLCEMHPIATLDRIRKFDYQPGDIILASYPKTGKCVRKTSKTTELTM